MSGNYKTLLSLERTDFAILFFRIAISSLMLLVHGTDKLIMLFGDEPSQFNMDPVGIGVTASLALATFAEFICSILVIIGLGTRLAVIPLIVTMVIAASIVMAPEGISGQETPLLYLAGYLMLFYTGAGRFYLDQLFLKK